MGETRKRKLTEKGEALEAEKAEKEQRTKRRMTAKKIKSEVDDLSNLFKSSKLEESNDVEMEIPKSDDTTPPQYWYSGGRKDKRRRRKTIKKRKH